MVQEEGEGKNPEPGHMKLLRTGMQNNVFKHRITFHTMVAVLQTPSYLKVVSDIWLTSSLTACFRRNERLSPLAHLL